MCTLTLQPGPDLQGSAWSSPRGSRRVWGGRAAARRQCWAGALTSWAVHPTQPPAWPVVRTRSAHEAPRRARPTPSRHAARGCISEELVCRWTGVWAPGQTGGRMLGEQRVGALKGTGALASETLDPLSGFSSTSMMRRGLHCLLEEPCPMGGLCTRGAPGTLLQVTG